MTYNKFVTNYFPSPIIGAVLLTNNRRTCVVKRYFIKQVEQLTWLY